MEDIGVGEFLDLKLVVDWSVDSGFHLLRLLPINDTYVHKMWWDSYPYSSLSVSLYLRLQALSKNIPDDVYVTGRYHIVAMKWTNLFFKELAHDGEMTMRETMDFLGRCAGVGTRLEMLAELSRREKDQGIKPDAELDAFMKAVAVSGHESSMVTEYVLRTPGLSPEIQNTPTKLAKESTSSTTKTN